MPTHDETPEFMREYGALSEDDRRKFRAASAAVRADLPSRRFRPSLRVKSFRHRDGVFEMSWGQNRRALWTYGPEVIPGQPHIVWLRIGTHDIFRPE